MKLNVPLHFSRAEAKVALDVLEILIDMLIELYGSLQRAYEPWTMEPDPEFNPDDDPETSP